MTECNHDTRLVCPRGSWTSELSWQTSV